ncbi:hypothetical protein RclHR1_12310005 [Rhizophagus clarus]|uniref:HMG box domain-containing protein n=1 Tax=Rhizophagus clarus TaxID=94130 RepID=A0A2Z6QBL4_9GLOM|nr:hypothetical protein RclHR1_12310005 [Rhizophagus clarus]GES73285.1 hypothetical protein GLOIN_2v1477894 [Rhizophagus clarus]
MGRCKSSKSVKKILANKSPRIQNAWISYSNYFCKQLQGKQKIKRTDAVKLASIAWNSMPAEQKYPWYHSFNRKKIEENIPFLNLSNFELLESTYDQFIIEDVSLMSMNQTKANNSTEEDHCSNSRIEEGHCSNSEIEEDHCSNIEIPSIASQLIDEGENKNEEIETEDDICSKMFDEFINKNMLLNNYI